MRNRRQQSRAGRISAPPPRRVRETGQFRVSTRLRVVVVGYGVQGRKRAEVAGPDVVAVVDPVADGVNARNIKDIPDQSYNAALVCTPDQVKVELLADLLARGKHVLVEKPMVGTD